MYICAQVVGVFSNKVKRQTRRLLKSQQLTSIITKALQLAVLIFFSDEDKVQFISMPSP